MLTLVGCRYDQSPSDPHNLRILSSSRGVQNEHFAAFEQVHPENGSLVLNKAADVLHNIESLSANKSHIIFCSFWAGPYVGFKDGWPAYWDGSQPNGTTPELYQGWRQMLNKYLPFNLAAFLSVAAENTFFTQAVWYEDHQGFMPCQEVSHMFGRLLNATRPSLTPSLTLSL